MTTDLRSALERASEPFSWEDLTGPLPESWQKLTGHLSALAQAVAHFDMSTPEARLTAAAVQANISDLSKQHTAVSRRLFSVMRSAERQGTATHFTVVNALAGDQESVDTLHTCASRGDLLATRVLALITEMATLTERVLRLVEEIAQALAPLLIAAVDLCALAPPRASLVGSLDSHAPPRLSRSGAPGLVQSLRNAPGRNDA